MPAPYIFRGVKEDYELSLLPDALHGKVYLNRLGVTGLTSGHKYVISQQKNSLEWACSCKGWIFSLNRLGYRECDHVIATGLRDVQPGENPREEIIEIIGAMRWYSQQAARFGEVTVD